MKHNIKVANVLLASIMLCAITVVGMAGWYFSGLDSHDDKTAMEQIKKKREDLEQKEFEEKNYMYVPKWDIKLGVGPNIPKVTVSEPIDLENKSEVKIIVKPPFLVYKDCGSEVTITRLQDISGLAEAPKHKLGDYHYYISDASDCSEAETSLNMDVLNHTELVQHFDALGVIAN